MGVVDEAIEDGVGIGRITDDLVPPLDGDLAGDDGRFASVSVFEDLQQIMASGIIERLETPVIEDQELRPEMVRMIRA